MTSEYSCSLGHQVVGGLLALFFVISSGAWAFESDEKSQQQIVDLWGIRLLNMPLSTRTVGHLQLSLTDAYARQLASGEYSLQNFASETLGLATRINSWQTYQNLLQALIEARETIRKSTGPHHFTQTVTNFLAKIIHETLYVGRFVFTDHTKPFVVLEDDKSDPSKLCSLYGVTRVKRIKSLRICQGDILLSRPARLSLEFQDDWRGNIGSFSEASLASVPTNGDSLVLGADIHSDLTVDTLKNFFVQKNSASIYIYRLRSFGNTSYLADIIWSVDRFMERLIPDLLIQLSPRATPSTGKRYLTLKPVSPVDLIQRAFDSAGFNDIRNPYHMSRSDNTAFPSDLEENKAWGLTGTYFKPSVAKESRLISTYSQTLATHLRQNHQFFDQLLSRLDDLATSLNQLNRPSQSLGVPAFFSPALEKTEVILIQKVFTELKKTRVFEGMDIFSLYLDEVTAPRLLRRFENQPYTSRNDIDNFSRMLIPTELRRIETFAMKFNSLVQRILQAD